MYVCMKDDFFVLFCLRLRAMIQRPLLSSFSSRGKLSPPTVLGLGLTVARMMHCTPSTSILLVVDHLNEYFTWALFTEEVLLPFATVLLPKTEFVGTPLHPEGGLCGAKLG